MLSHLVPLYWNGNVGKRSWYFFWNYFPDHDTLINWENKSIFCARISENKSMQILWETIWLSPVAYPPWCSTFFKLCGEYTGEKYNNKNITAQSRIWRPEFKTRFGVCVFFFFFWSLFFVFLSFFFPQVNQFQGKNQQVVKNNDQYCRPYSYKLVEICCKSSNVQNFLFVWILD